MNTKNRFFSIALLLGLSLAACGETGMIFAEQPEGGSTVGSVASSPEAAGSIDANTDHAQSHGGPVQDQVSVIDALRAKGYTVEPVESVEQPFFQAAGTLLRLRGGTLPGSVDLHAFSYEDAEAATLDARQLGPDGNPPTMMISWIAPPHFFRQGTLIVLYVGSNSEVLALLEELLGPQFAGQ